MKRISLKTLLIIWAIIFYSQNVLGQSNPELVLPIGHTFNIVSANFSPDGSRIATASLDGVVNIWETLTGKQLFSISGQSGRVTSVQYSPDGKTIATTSYDGTAKIWNATTGKLIGTLEKGSTYVMKANYSPNSKRIVTLRIPEKTPKVWNINTGKLQCTLNGHSSHVISALFSPDGKTIITASLDKTAKIWDANNGKLLFTLEGHTDRLLSAQFSPDGKTIITTSHDKTAKVWDVNTFKLLSTLEGHTSSVISADFSPDSKRIVTPSYDNTANVWDITTGKILFSIKGHDKRLTSAKFSPDGKTILTASMDNKAKLWDATTGELLFSMFSAEGHIALYSPNGNIFLTGTNNKTAKLWDVASGKLLFELKGLSHFVWTGQYSPDGKTIATVQYDGTGRTSLDHTSKIWDVTTGELLSTLNGHTGMIASIQYSPDSKTIVTASADKTAKVWDVNTGKLLLNIEGHTGAVYSAQYSSDGKTIVTASQDRTGKVWDSETGNLIVTLTHKRRGHTNKVWWINYSPDNTTILTASQDKTAKVWDALTGQLLYTLKGHKGEIYSAQYSPDGKTIITASSDKTAKIWDVAKGKLQHTLVGHTSNVLAAHYSPDGKTVLTVSVDKTARVWDAFSSKLLFTLEGHNHIVWKGNFSSDGKSIVTVSRDNTAKVWDAVSGKLIRSLKLNGLGIDINVDNETLFSHENSLLTSHDLNIGEVIYSWVAIGNNDYLLLHPEGYYKATKNAVSKLHWVDDNKKIFTFEQFDLKYNRPDIVLSRLGYASPVLIEAYKQAYLKRIRRMGFTEEQLSGEFHMPETEIVNLKNIETRTAKSSAMLKVKFNDSKYNLDRINVWVNDVPVYGINGISLRVNNTNSIDKDINIELNYGRNKIQVSCLNEKGAESYKETIEIFYDSHEIVKPNLHIVAICISEYMDSDMNLDYAVKDGRDIVEMFAKNQNNQYANILVDTLFDKNVVRENLSKIKQKLLQSDINDQVILFVAGHGLLDENYDFYFASYDLDFNNPALRGISYESLEDLLDGIPARQKLFMMDACHSGEVDREAIAERGILKERSTENIGDGIVMYSQRGFRVLEEPKSIGLQNSFDLMQELFVNLSRGSGAIVISAAAGDSYALESKIWNNGVFTYAVLDGFMNMKADKNNDKQVTISELRDYVVNQVENLTGGKQKPTMRQENYEFDWRVW